MANSLGVRSSSRAAHGDPVAGHVHPRSPHLQHGVARALVASCGGRSATRTRASSSGIENGLVT